MQTNFEVISAFLDDEPFAADELTNALSTPEGRRFLIDTIALRGMARSTDDVFVATPAKTRVARRLALVAAAILAAVASFQLGQRQALNAPLRAPEPTRVISGGPAWQDDSSRGGVR